MLISSTESILYNSLQNSRSNTLSNALSNSLSNALSNSLLSSLLRFLSSFLSNFRSNILSNVLSNSLSNALPNFLLSSLLSFLSSFLSNFRSNTLSNTLSNSLSNALSNFLSNSLSNFLLKQLSALSRSSKRTFESNFHLSTRCKFNWVQSMIWSWNIKRQEQKTEASIFLIALFDYSNYHTQLTRWCDDATYWFRRILLILKLSALTDKAYVKVLSQVHIHYDLHVVHWWSRRKQECCDLQKLTRQVVWTVIKLTQINLSYRDLHSDVSLVRCEVSRALTWRNLVRTLTWRGLATLTRLRTETIFDENCLYA